MSAGAGAGAYEAAGVDYHVLDAAKRSAIAAALSTSAFPLRRGIEVLDASRGEPAIVIRFGDLRLAQVLECLGTKSVIARECDAAFDAIGYDTVAAAVNDLICVGALPVLVNAYFATGSAGWYAGERQAQLVAGFARACRDAGAAWGGGESPTLVGLVAPDGIDLAASALGVVPAGLPEPLLGSQLAAGDEIVLVASTGLHANGASLARRVAVGLPAGWQTALPSGRPFGEAVLVASAIYVSLVEALIEAVVPVTYVSHITGHGLRKLMRADRSLTYRVHTLPEVPEVLRYLVVETAMGPAEAYATFNMGAGLAVYCKAGAGEQVVETAAALGMPAVVAGVVEAGERRVLLEPVGVTYEAGDLDLR